MSPQSLIANRFSLVQPIGTGGMGRVWLAHDELLRRDVAIKEVVPPRGMPAELQDALSEMVFREARAAAQVDHPNVVRIHDIIHWGRWPWIVMQYVPSRSLHAAVVADGPVSPDYAIRVGLALTEALMSAHRAGVLHRDVTPTNVLLARDGRIMLTDFGLAVWAPGDEIHGTETIGTAHYIAPERAVAGVSTPAGDCWSLGATLYAAVEGRPPYARATASASLSALATRPPDPPRCAGALTEVLCGLLEREPSRRLELPQAKDALRRLAEPRAPAPSPIAHARSLTPV